MSKDINKPPQPAAPDDWSKKEPHVIAKRIRHAYAVKYGTIDERFNKQLGLQIAALEGAQSESERELALGVLHKYSDSILEEASRVPRAEATANLAKVSEDELEGNSPEPASSAKSPRAKKAKAGPAPTVPTAPTVPSAGEPMPSVGDKIATDEEIGTDPHDSIADEDVEKWTRSPAEARDDMRRAVLEISEMESGAYGVSSEDGRRDAPLANPNDDLPASARAAKAEDDDKGSEDSSDPKAPERGVRSPENAELSKRITELAGASRGPEAANLLQARIAGAPETSGEFYGKSAPHALRMLESENAYTTALREHYRQRSTGKILLDQVWKSGLPPELQKLRSEWVASRADYGRYLRASAETRHLDRGLKSERTRKRDIDAVLERYQRRFTAREIVLGAEEAEQRAKEAGLASREKTSLDKAFEWYKKLPPSVRIMGTSAVLMSAGLTVGLAATGGVTAYSLASLLVGGSGALARWRAEVTKDPVAKKKLSRFASVAGLGAITGLLGEHTIRKGHDLFGVEAKAAMKLKQRENLGDLGNAATLEKLSKGRKNALTAKEDMERRARVARAVVGFGGAVALGAEIGAHIPHAHDTVIHTGGQHTPDVPHGSAAPGHGDIKIPDSNFKPFYEDKNFADRVVFGSPLNVSPDNAHFGAADTGGLGNGVDVSPTQPDLGSSIPSENGGLDSSALGGSAGGVHEVPINFDDVTKVNPADLHVGIPRFEGDLYAPSITVDNGFGYEHGLKELWEKIHNSGADYSKVDVPQDSDLYKLLHVAPDKHSVDTLIHQMAADKMNSQAGHGFFHTADGKNVLVEKGTEMTFDPKTGNVMFDQGGHGTEVVNADASLNAHLTQPFHPTADQIRANLAEHAKHYPQAAEHPAPAAHAPEVAPQPRPQPETEITRDLNLGVKHAPLPAGHEVAPIPPGHVGPTAETTPVTPAPSPEHTTVAAATPAHVESGAQPLDPSTIDTAHAHEYLSAHGRQVVFGGAEAERAAKAAEWVTNDHKAVVYYESTTRGIFGTTHHLNRVTWSEIVGNANVHGVPGHAIDIGRPVSIDETGDPTLIKAPVPTIADLYKQIDA